LSLKNLQAEEALSLENLEEEEELKNPQAEEALKNLENLQAREGEGKSDGRRR
jgi:hypothetical protein